MDTTAYCDTLENALSQWRLNLHDVIRLVDRLPAAQKEEAYPTLRRLKGVVGQIDTQLETLRGACPAGWSADRGGSEDWRSELKATLGRLSERPGGALIPDTLSWVSR